MATITLDEARAERSVATAAVDMGSHDAISARVISSDWTAGTVAKGATLTVAVEMLVKDTWTRMATFTWPVGATGRNGALPVCSYSHVAFPKAQVRLVLEPSTTMRVGCAGETRLRASNERTV